MGRMTRAKAAEVAEQLHVDPDEVLELPSDGIPQDVSATDAKDAATTTPERAPLGELAPNSAESLKTEDASVAEKKGKGRKGAKKGGKGGNKQDLSASVREEDNDEAQGEVHGLVGDEGGVAVETGHVDAPDVEESASQTSSPGQMRQTKPAMEATQHLKNAIENEQQEMGEAIPAGQMTDVRSDLPAIAISGQQSDDTAAMSPQSTLDKAPASPLASAMPSAVKNLRTDTPGKRSTSNKENVEPIVSTPSAAPSTARIEQQPVTAPLYDSLEDAVVQDANPTIQRRSSTRSEDAIEKLDDLDDAVDKVNQEIPDISPSRAKPSSPKEASPKQVAFEEPSESATEPAPASKPTAQDNPPVAPKSVMAAPPKPAPKPRTKPAPVVRTTKASAARLSLAQAPKTLSTQKTGPRPSTTMALSRSSSVRQSTTTTTTKPPTSPNAARNTTNIPHSKPRPVSLSFPTPPPPPKSSKAPTTSTFQLPGEAVAAKLKAAREAREARDASTAEAKAERKPSFKARPVPTSSKPAPTVRQTKASGARESAIGGSAGALARSASVRKATSTTAPAPAASTLHVSKRPRPSSMIAASTAPISAAQRAPSNGSGTAKGKEVFNRAALAKNSAEAEKKGKEEAAKKARAEAAERSRQMSREWAEKRKAKATAGKSAGEGTGTGKKAAVTA